MQQGQYGKIGVKTQQSDLTQVSLRLVCWNCRGYPWRWGPGLGLIAEDRYIIRLLETHEHEGCKTPVFEGYLKMAVWNKAAENGKGHRGIMVLVREKKGRLIQLEG